MTTQAAPLQYENGRHSGSPTDEVGRHARRLTRRSMTSRVRPVAAACGGPSVGSVEHLVGAGTVEGEGMVSVDDEVTGSGPVAHAFQRFISEFALSPSRLPRRSRAEIDQPCGRSRLPWRRRAIADLLAIVLPAVVAAAMIPLRADHGRTTAIVLVVPVVAVAALGATGPAVVAALSAGLSYDVLLTEPYYRLAIDDSDDLAAAITLVVVGLIVGVLSSRLVRFTARAAARRTELQHLLDFVTASTGTLTESELADEACGHIAAVLNLADCRWSPGHHPSSGALLLPDGNVMGHLTDLDPDQAKLPRQLELPAVAGTIQIGRFVLTSDRQHVTSYEERLTAATIASLFATVISRAAST